MYFELFDFIFRHTHSRQTPGYGVQIVHVGSLDRPVVDFSLLHFIRMKYEPLNEEEEDKM